MSRILLLTLGFSLTLAAVVSQVGDDRNDEVLTRGRVLMAEGKAREAAAVLEGIEGDPLNGGVALEGALLRAWALVEAKEVKKGAEAARRLLEGLPAEHAARGRARWVVSQAMARLGRMDESVAHLARFAEEVLGEGQKARLAGYYLALAKEASAGRKSEDPLKPSVAPDPKRGAALRGKALEILTGGKPLAAVTLPRARDLLNSKQGLVAAKELETLLKDPKAGLKPAEDAEARHLRARGLAQGRRWAEARDALLELLARPNVEETKFAPAGWKLLGSAWLNSGSYEDAVRAWESFLERFPDHEDAPGVRESIAVTHGRNGQREKAIEAWKRLAADTRAKKDARARALYAVAGNEASLKHFEVARKAFQTYLATYPDDRQVPAAQRRLVRLLLEKAEHQRSQDQKLESIRTLERFLVEYPLASQAPGVALEVGARYRELKRAQDALAAYAAARDRYRSANREVAGTAALFAGIIEEEELDDLEKAIVSYRKVQKEFRGTSAASKAGQRIARLEEVELDLSTPRIYAPGETASVKLVSRNVPDATLRVYAINAPEVFARRGHLDQAAEIEIALVKADHSASCASPDYQRYRRRERSIPISLKEGEALPEGSYLVAVETEDRRSVVLVIVSSLRVVVKQSPHELFCWVVDAKSGEPREGVNLKVRGPGVNTEIRSGKDGVARLRHDKAKGRCRVLAIDGASVSPGQAPDFPQAKGRGLAPQVAFTLDRPIYRPGSELRFQATLRAVSAGSFVTPEPTRVRVRLRDPRGRIFAERRLRSGDYGGVHGSFRIPADAAVGSYRVALSFEGKEFSEVVDVEAYKKPEYAVSVVPEQRVVRPGEKVKAKVEVNYSFGSPVTSATFRYQVWRRRLTIDKARFESHAWYLRAIAGNEKRSTTPGSGMEYLSDGMGQTDDQGRAEVEFRTALAGGLWEYRVFAMVQDSANQWVNGSGAVAVGERDRFAVVLSQRKAWREGETAELRVLTRDLLQMPVATRGRVSAEIARQGGAQAWETLRELSVDTGLDGEAVVHLELPEAGDYRLRFEGEDRNGVPVVAECRVSASGKRADLAKEARLAFERKVYKAGDRARMHLNLPVVERPVLLCFEAESVLAYRILRPKAKFEVHELAVEDAFAPNAMVTVAAPFEGKLLEARDELVVLRYLQLELEPEKRVATPGEKVGIAVRTLDQSGRPVAANVVLRAVDGALSTLGRAGTDPRFVFNQDRRQHLVRTGSTWSFDFKGATRFLDPDLLRLKRLREQERLKEMAKSLAPSEAPVLRDSPASEEADAEEEFEESKGDEDRIGARAQGLGGGAGGRFGGRRGRKRASRKGAGPTANSRGGVFVNEKSLVSGITPKLSLGRPMSLSEIALAEPTVRETFLEVAGWWPALVTDANGRARVTLELPGNLTTWRVGASGATKDTNVGREETRIAVRQDVVLRLAKPRFIGSSDRFDLPVQLHSNLEDAQAFTLELGSKTPDRLAVEGMSSTSFELPARGEALRLLTLQAKEAGVARLYAKALSAKGGDALEVGLPVIPFGAPWEHADSRRILSEASFDVHVPGDAIPGSEDFRVVVTAGLLSELLGGLEYLERYPYGCLEQNVNRFLPALSLHAALTASGMPSALDPKTLRRDVEQGCDGLAAWQRPDGTYSYWPGGPAHPWATALALEGLVRANRAGYEVNSALLSSSLHGAHRMVRNAALPADSRAALLWAMVQGGRSDSEVALAVFRKRDGLSIPGLARLLLASKAMGLGDRLPMLARELESRSLPPEHPKRQGGRRPWPGSRLESAAFLLLASGEVELPGVDRAQLAKTVRSLLQTRRGGTKAVAVAIDALVAYGRSRLHLLDAGPVKVFVDGKLAVEGSFAAAHAPLSLTIDPKHLGAGKHRIRIARGAGEAARVQLRLRQVTRGEQSEGDGNLISVTRRVIAYQDPHRQQSEHEPGYSVYKAEHRPKPKTPPSLGQIVAGQRLSVELVVTAREELRWLVIEDPQFAGCELIESGVRGSHDRFERRATRLLFFRNLLEKGESMRIVYPAYAVHQGSFASMPARASLMYEPEVWGRSASAALEVVADAKMLADVEEIQPTPDEIYAEGREAFGKGAYEAAIEALTPLTKSGFLREEIMDEATRMLWLSHLRLGHHRRAVDLEEEMRIRNPRKISIGVEDQDRMGRAWMALGDAEMAQPWFQRVVVRGLEADLEVTRTYAESRRRKDEVQHLRNIIQRYPVDLASSVWLSLPELLIRTANPKLGKNAALLPPIHRVQWREAQDASLDLMAWRSGSELASRAALARLDVWGRLDHRKAVIVEGERYLARFPKAQGEDGVRWTLAQAHFDLEAFAAAAKEAEAVWKWIRPSTRRSRSKHRSEAGYLLGKIAHVRGDTEEAVSWYGRVMNKVSDARQSWLFFTEKRLSVDPVTRSTPGQAAKIPLRVKNVDEVRAQVYPVDLLVLFAMKKSFDRLSVADLSGIKPAQEVSVKPKLPRYEDGNCALDLGQLGAGAYLVMIRGGELHAGTLLQVSDARVTIQRQAGSLRIYLTDGSNKPIAGAKVRMAVGSRIFHSGETDVRGMLSVRDPGRGTITVVATSGDTVAVGTKE